MDNKVLAVVNGIEITEEALNNAIFRFPAERKQYFTTPEGRKQLLDQVISWELAYNYALDSGFESRPDYIAQMEEAKKAILTQITIQDVISSVTVDEAELLEYYNENSQYFKEEEQVDASHILVDTLEKAEEILQIMNNGMTFKEAAQLYSSCPSKAQGGSLGAFGRGMMVPEFEDAAFSLEVGVISQPVKTQFGYHLILVNEKIDAEAKSFEEVKDSIRNHISQEKQNYTYANFINGLKDKYSVEVK